MQDRVDSIKQSIDSIRKSGTLPHWRMVYADALLTRAQEYVAVDRLPEAGHVLDKLDRWVATHTPKVAENSAAEMAPMVFWSKDLLTKCSEQIKKTLAQKGMLVPPTEKDAILRRLSLVEKWIAGGNLQQAHQELLSLRSALIARLRRSYRARLIAFANYRNGRMTQPEGTLIGLYNARHTLEETFHVVGERDPIWVEDFLDIYNELFRIVDRLVPQEKK